MFYSVFRQLSLQKMFGFFDFLFVFSILHQIKLNLYDDETAFNS